MIRDQILQLSSRLRIILLIISISHSLKVVGHRGSGCSQFNCTSLYPENSIVSFINALKNGADIVELDTWISKDDQIVVTHRNTNLDIDDLYSSIVPESFEGKTPTSGEYNHKEREKYKTKMPWAVDKPERDEYNSDQYNVSYKDHGPIYIPLLSEVFTEVCPLGKQIIVELKGNRADLGPRVIQLAKDMDIVNCIHTFSSFHWSKFNPSRANEVDLLEPLRNETIIPKALLFKFRPEELLNPLKAAEYYNVTALHTNCQLLWNDIEVRNQIFHRAQTGDIYDQKPNNEQYDSNSQKKEEFKLQRKLTTSCYFSAEYTDTVEELEKTIDMNVLDEICTNNPQLLRQILDQREFRRIEIDEEQSSEL